jgi:hypothetical protein
MTFPHVASAGTIDDIKIEASHDPCGGQSADGMISGGFVREWTTL